MAKYAYYPGCSLHASAREYDISWQGVCQKLGLEMVEMEDWSCCGTVHANNVDQLLATALAARNLSIAEEAGLDIVAPCSGCYKNLRVANEMLKADASLRETINAALPGRSFQGTTRVRHPLHVVLEDVGLQRLADVPKPLHGLRVAPYYGCVLTRPVSAEPGESAQDPQSLDLLLEALGADVVPFYPYKTRCCGGGVLLSHTDVAVGLAGQILEQAQRRGADCLAVICPMCQMALDAYQPQAEKQLGDHLGLPVLYFTQLLGFALGIEPSHLGLERLVISPAKVLAHV